MPSPGDSGESAASSGAAGEELAAVMAERRRLMSLAYRMLGTLGEAEDAVQECYLRWYRLSEGDREEIANPQGWLTTATSRICLDMLGSARARREVYVGEWLPEPVPANLFVGTTVSDDPVERVMVNDAVSMALLVVLETMTPAERVTFVLHDVFAVPFAEVSRIVGRSAAAVRQLASSARRRVREAGSVTVDPVLSAEHDAIVRAFGAACREGDLEALTALLDPRVTLRSDGGGFVSAALRPVSGVSNVARFVLGVLAKQPGLAVREEATGDGLGYSWSADDVVRGILNLGVSEGRVTEVWFTLNPQKLGAWRQ